MKAYFLSRHIREKMLILGLVVFAIAFWLPSLIGRTNKLVSDLRTAESTFAKQQETLDQRAEIEAEEAAAVNRLKPELSFDKLQLNAEISKMADAASVTSKQIGSPMTKTASSRQLAISSIKVTLSNVDMPTLIAFYRELAKRAPYITITDCNITQPRATRQGRGGLTGTTGVTNLRNGVAAVVQNTGNGVTDTGPAAGGPGGRRGGAATDPNADPTAYTGRGRGPAQPVLPGNMNVVFDLTAVQILRPGSQPAPKAATPRSAVPVPATPAAPAAARAS